jgi:polyhydroxybutyrate depolymerase
VAPGSSQRSSSGFGALSDRDGFVITWPNGIDNAWNIGPCCTRSRDVDDLGFAKAIVAEVTSAGCIDSKRIYATGFSMGGGFSHFLACSKLEDVVDALVAGLARDTIGASSAAAKTRIAPCTLSASGEQLVERLLLQGHEASESVHLLSVTG